MERSRISNSLNRVLINLNSVLYKIMVAMIIVLFIAFMFIPTILEELKEATTDIVIDSLSEKQEHFFEEILANIKESINISAQPFVLKQEALTTKEDLEAWEVLLLGISNSLNRQYGLIRILSFDLSGKLIHDYGIDENVPRFDSGQSAITTMIAEAIEAESSSQSVIASNGNMPYWGLCFLSEDRDEEVSNVHLFIVDYRKILEKIKETTGMDIVIQVGSSIIHNNLGGDFIESINNNSKAFLASGSEGDVQHYIVSTSTLDSRHIQTREPVQLVFFINSESIYTSFKSIAGNLKYVILLITSLASLLLLAIIQYFLRPMKRIPEIAQAVSNGDYSIRLNHKGRDEIGTAMTTIDDMLDKIQLNYRIINKEMSERKQAEEKLELILNSTGEGIYGLDLSGNTTFVNLAAAKMIGMMNEDLAGRNLQDILRHSNVDGIFYHQDGSPIYAVLKDGEIRNSSEELFWRKDGSSFPVEYMSTPMRDDDNEIIGAVVTFMDITERIDAENKLHNMAYYDQLTNLPNRANFISCLSRMINRARHHGELKFAVLFIDLDRFKLINDSLGHIVGDKLLVEVARRLELCTRPTDRVFRDSGEDKVSRFGGDEFAIFLNDINDAKSVPSVADRIQSELQKPFYLDGHELYTSASIGIALSSTGYANAEDILRDADSAMYRAKSLGKARAEIFDNEMRVRVSQTLKLESDLRSAAEKEQFMVYYQPIVSTVDRKIRGAEALIRWKHNERGFISPVEFIPIAEEIGLISKIGEWVFRKACTRNKEWQEAGYNPLVMKINFSSRQFKDDSLVETIENIIRDIGISSEFLDVEITESIAMDKNSIKILNQLTALGLNMSIDDFGTGYSSLGSLAQFPINTIKIDRVFVKDIAVESSAEAIIKAIIAMAHSLNMDVVAEGVETEEQLAFLQSYDCDKIQGFLFSPPVPEGEFIKLLEQNKTGPLSFSKQHSAPKV